MSNNKKPGISKNKIQKTPDLTNVETKQFSSGFLDKKLIISCAASALISVVTVFIIMKIGLNYQEAKIRSVADTCSSLEARMKSISESMTDLNASIDSLKSEWKESKEHSSYLYTNLSSVQKDIALIKDRLNLTDKTEDNVKKLSSDKGSFIESFENLIKEGAPFESFLASQQDKIDMTKYRTSSELIKYAKQDVKSISDLKKDFDSVGYSLFKTKFEESFWERQKRIIKEKISEAIKIKKDDENSKSEVVSENASDKKKFEEAGKLLSDAKYSEAVKIFESLKIENEDLSDLISAIKKRQALEEAFAEFKKEFMEMENASDQKDSKEENKKSEETEEQ